ncbi:L-threonylcarbamoyladenylate synthase [Burkholderiales bacterium]|nr:L-threonylcarbamoyladenylate synthase [Burkholderiales bacterium]
MSKRITTDISAAARLLTEGQLVAFPTETVYGLGADALNPDAVRRVYEAKSRPLGHPLIIHVGSTHLIDELAQDIPDNARALIRYFWPGPLTLVLKASDNVPRIVTGGQDTVAIRFPAHPMAIALLKEFGGGVVGPSANKFGHLSPTKAADVDRDFGPEVGLILNGASCAVGIESTIIGFDGEFPVMLRPGMITKRAISAEISKEFFEVGAKSPRVPGSLSAHYAPTTRLVVLHTDDIRRYLKENSELHGVALLTITSFFKTHPINKMIVASTDPDDYAKNLYESLRVLDRVGAKVIIVEAVPLTDAWDGIRDRLERAAGSF